MEKQYEYINNLSEEIKISIKKYTDEPYFEEINKQNLTLITQKIYNDILKAFKNAPPLEKSITVYRGLKEAFDPLKGGFISTSLDFDTALTFTKDDCCLVIITIPIGGKVLPIENISTVPNEKEVLLDPNSKFIIKEIDTTGIKTYILELIVPGAPAKPTTKITPENILSVENDGNKSYSKDFWINRIINIITPEEIEILGIDEAVNSIMKEFPEIENNQEIKQELIKYFIKSNG